MTAVNDQEKYDRFYFSETSKRDQSGDRFDHF